MNKKMVNSWHNLSPFIKEWIYNCITWSSISLFLFILMVILKIFFGFFPEDSWWSIIKVFFKFAFLICCFVTLYCSTPRKELLDKIKRYPAVKMKMSLGAIDSFHTSLPTDHIPTQSTHINDFAGESYSYPLMVRCCTLDDDFVFKTSLRQKRLSFATAYDSDVADIDDPSMLFVTNDMKLSADEKTIYCYKLRLLADYEVINKLDDLIAVEPTMEFQITFLQHSHLILSVDPIDYYPYDEHVYDFLRFINERIHPWIQRDSVRLLSEKKISKIKNRMNLKQKLTRPNVKDEVVKNSLSDDDIDRILTEYRKSKNEEKKL